MLSRDFECTTRVSAKACGLLFPDSAHCCFIYFLLTSVFGKPEKKHVKMEAEWFIGSPDL
jgi:hypothetical protein